MEEEKQSRTLQRRKMRRRRRRKRIAVFFITVATLLFLVVGGGLTWAWSQISGLTNDTFNPLPREVSDLRPDQESVNIQDDHVSVLFLGVDSREGAVSGRSDAMILATFNRDDSSVKMLSIPRDSYVEIPGRGSERISHAHAYGEHDLAVETVENFLDVPVDYYATINFQAFIEIVDTFGGITVDSDISFSEQDSEHNPDAIFIEEGVQELNGEEALAYVRHRNTDGDLARGNRQTEVIASLINEATSISNISNYDDAFKSLENNMNHNIEGFQELIAFHSYASSLDSMERFQLEGTFERIDGSEVIVIDDTSLANARLKLRNHLELDDSEHP
ncbi:LCP family protein [Geomicrobium sediminis]|uniref:LCP family protein required for cell wall assembly n=1 Tax=Geomicrobium sediminis TaxID=1347788 RepID=A0ABS2P7C1_9BACL|nr:LCP family protein [Geomicrobium sediminis]MBM7631290.1 LCP family protein required for cell wall assembly [Geomicrobium sediminis]